MWSEALSLSVGGVPKHSETAGFAAIGRITRLLIAVTGEVLPIFTEAPMPVI